MPGTFSPAFSFSGEQCGGSASSSTSREATASPTATTCPPSPSRPVRKRRGLNRSIRGPPARQRAPGHTLPRVASHERQGPVLRARPRDAKSAARLVPRLPPPHAREVQHLRIRDQAVRLAREARGGDARGPRELPVRQPRGAAGLRRGRGLLRQRPALHRRAPRLAIEYALSRDTVVYRSAQPCEYRLSQVADYICTMELTAIKFAEHATTATDEKFFGKWSDFKRGILKETRKKLV